MQAKPDARVRASSFRYKLQEEEQTTDAGVVTHHG